MSELSEEDRALIERVLLKEELAWVYRTMDLDGWNGTALLARLFQAARAEERAKAVAPDVEGVRETNLSHQVEAIIQGVFDAGQAYVKTGWNGSELPISTVLRATRTILAIIPQAPRVDAGVVEGVDLDKRAFRILDRWRALWELLGGDSSDGIEPRYRDIGYHLQSETRALLAALTPETFPAPPQLEGDV